MEVPERARDLLTGIPTMRLRHDPPATDAGLAQGGTEPEGFGDAVEAAALMLALMTALAGVGFTWQRDREQAAHRFAVDLVERIGRLGDATAVPVWSGFGPGPRTSSARDAFRALGHLGGLAPDAAGRCRVDSRFALCQGTRYGCQVSGRTPAGPVEVSVGLCSTGAHAPYTFDTFDLTLPLPDGDPGNRGGSAVRRDGFIRYGATPLRPAALPVRLHRRAPWR